MGSWKKRGPVTKKENRKVESVMFLPHTVEGELKNRLTKMEQNLGLKSRIKFVERVGKCLGSLLIKKDPWTGVCGCESCMPCMTGGGGRCMRKGVVYSIMCKLCEAKGMKSVYFGESARTPFDRGQEQMSALDNQSEKSPLWNHHREVHSVEEKPEFSRAGT